MSHLLLGLASGAVGFGLGRSWAWLSTAHEPFAVLRRLDEQEGHITSRIRDARRAAEDQMSMAATRQPS